MKEEVIVYSGNIDVSSEKALEIKDLDITNGEFNAKYASKILDTNVYTDINYIMSFSKVIEVFDEYKQKPYSWKDGGVKIAQLDKISDIEKQFDKFSGSISIHAHGGKQFGWGGQSFYRIEIFSFRDETPNFFSYIDVTTPELAADVLRKFTKCVLHYNIQHLTERVKSVSLDIAKNTETLVKLTNILNDALESQEPKILN